MVVGAKRKEILEVGVAIVLPRDDVVGLAPIDGAVATGPRAGRVQRAERRPLGVGRCSIPTADVDDDALVVDHNPADHRVAGEPVDSVRRQRPTTARLMDR